MECPKCHSKAVHVELRHAGTTSRTKYYRTGVKHSWILPAGAAARKSNTRQKSVALCQNCGYHWTVGEENNKGCLFYLLAFAFFPVSLSVLFCKTDLIKLDRRWRILITVVVWVVLLVILAQQPTVPKG